VKTVQWMLENYRFYVINSFDSACNHVRVNIIMEQKNAS
jgi:hypothetical protein